MYNLLANAERVLVSVQNLGTGKGRARRASRCDYGAMEQFIESPPS
jgi:hypothetical protein